MTLDEYRDQIERMKRRFGQKAFDEEFIKLVWREVKDMSQYDFVRTADVMIGTRNHTRPPSIVDFREARYSSGSSGQRTTGKLGEDRPVASCADCRDSGFMHVTYRGVSGYAPCHCSRGAELLAADKRAEPKRQVGFRTQYGPHWHDDENTTKDGES
jgi:hypothetical protein